MPISDRNPSAQVLAAHGRLFLIDAGEGCQQQMRRCHISISKIDTIFLSHIHGDHVFGIFGLLNSMSMYGKKDLLKIYAPANFGPILKFYLSYFTDADDFPIEHCPISSKVPEVVMEDARIRVTALPLKHKIESYGYRFDELGRDGEVVCSYSYCSDTLSFPELSEWVKGSTMLYHETTYPAEYEDKAIARFHSTTLQAANCAKEAGVGTLLIGHYSSRERNTELYRTECATIFPNTVAAQDCDEFVIK